MEADRKFSILSFDYWEKIFHRVLKPVVAEDATSDCNKNPF